MVEGAIKNTCDAHGEDFDPYFARSVAKRAAGTLSAAMPSMLAAKPSEKLGCATQLVTSNRAAQNAQLVKLSVGHTVQGPKVRAVSALKAAPLRSLNKWMFRQMRDIKGSGRTEYAEAFIDVLKQIAILEGRK